MRRIIFEIITMARFMLWGPGRKVLAAAGPGGLLAVERALASLARVFLKGRKGFLTEELKRSYGSSWPRESIESAVDKSFDVYVGSQLRTFHLPRMNPANIDEYVAIEGIENLDKALAAKKGAIVLNPHFGPFMLIMPALGHRGYSVSQVALQGKEPEWRKRRGLDQKVYEMKLRAIEGNMPVKFINAAEGAFTLREIIKRLKNNEVVLYPSTGRGGASFHAVGLMGRKAALSLTPFSIAAKTGAALIPAFLIVDGKRTILKLEVPIDYTVDSKEEEMLERYAGVLDSHIERYPEHFIMFIYEVHKMTLMGGEPMFLDEQGAAGPRSKERAGGQGAGAA